uniref:RNase H domain-containing protein n=1 Tax=Rhabditophanes sp. KR3021 TaxID=114890 RepID=A0AC35TWQ3_9BILA
MPAAWTDEEGNLKRSTPAQRYFVNDEVRPSRWNNEVVDCSPSQIYFKPRGHLSKMFELGSKVGELGDSIYLIQDQRGENHLVSRNFTKAVISRADPSMESTDSIEARRRETKPSAEQEIPEASSSITTDEELYMLLEALVNGDKAFMVVDGSASNKKELEKSTEEKYHGVAGVGFVNAPVAFRKRNFLRGRTTAPRMEAVAALEACAIAMDARVKDLTLISDCEYVVKGIRNNTYKEWLNDKSTPHSSTWKELDKHVKRGLNIETIHITAHSISLHNLVDAMARGEDIEGWIVKLKPGVEKCGVGLEEIRACYK